MSNDESLAAYPNILALHKQMGAERGVLQELSRLGGFSLSLVDRALSSLHMDSRPSLRGLSGDLFSSKEKKVYAAICEIIAFGWLMEKGLLVESGIGFPQDWQGDDPPFEGVLRIGAQDIPFDVKDASGVGLWLLESILQKEVDKEASAANLPSPQVRVALNAPSGQRWVEDNFASIVRPFQQDLKQNGLMARVISLRAGSGFVKVGVDYKVGASISGLDEKASFVGAQVLRHAEEKAKKLGLTSTDRFMLVYLKRPGSGPADFDRYTIGKAFDFLSHESSLPASLVGVLFVEFDHSDGQLRPQSFLWDRQGDLPDALRKVVDEIYEPQPRTMPKVHRANAQSLRSSEMEATTVLVSGSCDLRGVGCRAPGSIGPVFVFFANGVQYHACAECRRAFGWPTPSSKS